MIKKAQQMKRLAELMEARFMAGQGKLKERLSEEERLSRAVSELDEARHRAIAATADPVRFSPSHAKATAAWLRWTEGRKIALNRDLARARAATAEARAKLARNFSEMQASQKVAEKIKASTVNHLA